ncbi:TetR family transcriptional regulator C-terminal domain-containing protein [Microbacterium sp. 2FI]|uniref:TetR/AcrR family transcriptional regulator n=1 Tax=Microbacterium sp. 2FI TaxID=2502193 RepID=UPI0010F6810C|nr:TetR family transcriptional regulator C-terminal domain-containing protein [Microbacterium sp. 2FI]
MPREVDADQRLADIAEATVQVARTMGAHAVTIRSVAGELGGSTTLVTNYLPTRAALILNALDHGRDRWRGERDAALAAAAPGDRLRILLDWSLSSTSDDPVLRTLILEIVANASVEPVMREALQHESVEFQAFLEQAAAESGFADPHSAAQLAYLLVRGAYIATIEDSEHWSEAHVRGLVHAAIDALPRAVDAGHHRTT